MTIHITGDRECAVGRELRYTASGMDFLSMPAGKEPGDLEGQTLLQMSAMPELPGGHASYLWASSGKELDTVHVPTYNVSDWLYEGDDELGQLMRFMRTSISAAMHGEAMPAMPDPPRGEERKRE